MYGTIEDSDKKFGTEYVHRASQSYLMASKSSCMWLDIFWGVIHGQSY